MAERRGRVGLDDFERLRPRHLLTTSKDLAVREVAMTSFAGEPVYPLALADGRSRLAWRAIGRTIRRVFRVHCGVGNPAATKTVA